MQVTQDRLHKKLSMVTLATQLSSYIQLHAKLPMSFDSVHQVQCLAIEISIYLSRNAIGSGLDTKEGCTLC